MDKKKIIDRYKKEKNLTPSFLLRDGAIVVGEEVDEENKLYYVIKRGSELTVERANKNRPFRNLKPATHEKVTIKYGT